MLPSRRKRRKVKAALVVDVDEVAVDPEDEDVEEARREGSKEWTGFIHKF